ncbi:hypothetical protein B0H13DRAFT_1906710 [Mycena leptocephala]|nr:hypothetical protein B0H13DRAFT_1906710 [Mycena leptocephala]
MNISTGAWLCDPRKGCELSNFLQEHEYFNGRMALAPNIFSVTLARDVNGAIFCKNMNISTGAWLARCYFPVIYPVAPNIFSVTRARNTKFTAVEGTRNSLPLKEHGNSLPLKQHKITAVERTRNSLQLREHEILLSLKEVEHEIHLCSLD